jgi:hypothetical protein
MVPLYYLLYQVKNRLEYWIAKVDDDYYYLSRKIKNYNSEYEKYILVERYVNKENIEDEINKKQFNIFNPKYNDIIIKETFFKNDNLDLDNNQKLDLFNNILDDSSFNQTNINNNNEDSKNNKEYSISDNYDTDDEIVNIFNKKSYTSSKCNKHNFKERLKLLKKHIRK